MSKKGVRKTPQRGHTDAGACELAQKAGGVMGEEEPDADSKPVQGGRPTHDRGESKDLGEQGMGRGGVDRPIVLRRRYQGGRSLREQRGAVLTARNAAPVTIEGKGRGGRVSQALGADPCVLPGNVHDALGPQEGVGEVHDTLLQWAIEVFQYPKGREHTRARRAWGGQASLVLQNDEGGVEA